MNKGKDMRDKKIERELSRIASLVALATEDAEQSKTAAASAKARLDLARTEIEQLYMTLDEPFAIITSS